MAPEPTRGTFTVDGESFAYLAWGDPSGEPVLCLHGFPDVPHTWGPVAERLAAEGYRVVAPWMRGYAPSTLRGPFTVEQLANDALAFADFVSPGAPLRIVGHDWGAVVTYAATAAARSRFLQAATIAVPHPNAFFAMLGRDLGQWKRSAYMGFFQLPRLPERTLRQGNFAFLDKMWRAWSPGVELPTGYLDEVKASLRASLPAPLEYYRSLVRPARAAFDRFRRAAAPTAYVAVPTLYLHGDRDRVMPPPPGDLHRRWFTGPCEQRVVPNAGHFAELDNPAYVAAELLRWFRTVA
ncbi:MAG: alpha/beta fold hydrolase [Myxococcales bacterium]|nr:alpha/beta fold hydrolase [Myxococcales bacterium]